MSDKMNFMLYLIISSHLFASDAGEAPYITSSGFQFLLLDTASQLWYFILQYLKTAQVHAFHHQLRFDKNSKQFMVFCFFLITSSVPVCKTIFYTKVIVPLSNTMLNYGLKIMKVTVIYCPKNKLGTLMRKTLFASCSLHSSG